MFTGRLNHYFYMNKLEIIYTQIILSLERFAIMRINLYE